MLESQQDASASDDAAVAAAHLCRVGVVVYPLRLSPEGHEFDSRTRRPIWGAGLLEVVAWFAPRKSARFESEALHQGGISL